MRTADAAGESDPLRFPGAAVGCSGPTGGSLHVASELELATLMLQVSFAPVPEEGCDGGGEGEEEPGGPTSCACPTVEMTFPDEVPARLQAQAENEAAAALTALCRPPG